MTSPLPTSGCHALYAAPSALGLKLLLILVSKGRVGVPQKCFALSPVASKAGCVHKCWYVGGGT